MADEQEARISRADVESTAQKLQQFAQQLSPNEQIVVEWLLDRAAQAAGPTPNQEAEVSGYACGISGPSLLQMQRGTMLNEALGLPMFGYGEAKGVDVAARRKIRLEM